MGRRTPINPVEQTATSPAPTAEQPGGVLGRGVRVLEALGSGAGVGTSGVQHDGLHLAARHNLLRPEHGGCSEAVAGEHAGGRPERSVVEHEGDVRPSPGAETRGDPGCPEARGVVTLMVRCRPMSGRSTPAGRA